MAELVYPPVIAAARTMFKALDLRLDISGSEHVPTSGGAVLVSNHIGYLDFVFAGFAARPSKRLVRFMAKDSVFRHKVSGPLMRGMKHIPVDRKQESTPSGTRWSRCAAGRSWACSRRRRYRRRSR